MGKFTLNHDKIIFHNKIPLFLYFYSINKNNGHLLLLLTLHHYTNQNLIHY